MNFFRLTLLTCSFALFASIALALPQEIYGQAAKDVKDVVVTNYADRPVPTKNVESPARQAFQVGFEVAGGGETPVVPTGKIFVIEYVSAGLRTVTSFGEPSPCRIQEMNMSVLAPNSVQPEPFYFAPLLMGSATGLNGEVNMYTLSQPVRLYAGPGWGFAASWLAGPVCGNPGIQGRIVLTGYLVDAAR